MQASHAGAVAAPIAAVSVAEVKLAREALEAKLLELVNEFEQRHDCQITNLWCDGSPRTTAVRASVSL